MGKHTVGSMVEQQIKAAGYNTKEMKISGTSLRKNMFDTMVQSDVPDVLMSAQGGHKNTKSKESYVTKTTVAKKALNRILGDSLKGEETCRFQDIVEEEQKKEREKVKVIKTRGNDLASEDKENLSPPLNSEPSSSGSQQKKFKSIFGQSPQLSHDLVRQDYQISPTYPTHVSHQFALQHQAPFQPPASPQSNQYQPYHAGPQDIPQG